LGSHDGWFGDDQTYPDSWLSDDDRNSSISEDLPDQDVFDDNDDDEDAEDE
jgi:hypothetical protein